jgi:hypothetical protein
VERVVRRFAVRDLFGLSEIAWRRTETVSLRVLPERGMLAQMPPPAGMADGDDLSDVYAEPRGDRVEMRQYAPGDPLRMVLWKVYARTNRMMVRTPERSVAERRKGCAYLVASPNDDSTAAVARIAIERNLLGDDWCFAADGAAAAGRGSVGARRYAGDRHRDYADADSHRRRSRAAGRRGCPGVEGAADEMVSQAHGG